jgi:hypothetical protein
MAGRVYFDSVLSAACLHILTFGMILRWQMNLFLNYREFTTQQQAASDTAGRIQSRSDRLKGRLRRSFTA